MWISDPRVAIASHPSAGYPTNPPYDPSTAYPEYCFGRISQEPNAVYDQVREALRLLELDDAHFGTPQWNPLAELVRPGDTVLLKPNWLREPPATDRQAVVTSGSVIRSVADYVAIALKGRGRIVIADGPQTDSDFELISRRTGLNQIVRFFREAGVQVDLYDLRRHQWRLRDDVITARQDLPGDPAGYVTVDLGPQSEFADYVLNGRFYGADYDVNDTAQFHTGRHAYVLCRTPLLADVVINLPKLKTHKKVGVTLSLKAMVGINGYRNCLPHHTTGTTHEGGDEFPAGRMSDRLQSRATLAFKAAIHRHGGTGGVTARAVKRLGRRVFGPTSRVIRQGNWHGNDTAWRMVLDLNRILFHFDAAGKQRVAPIRYMSIVDGIIGGEGNGPSHPDAKESGVVVAGFNPVAVDTVCAMLMGFDAQRIPMINRAWARHSLPLVGFESNAIQTLSNNRDWSGDWPHLLLARHLDFTPHFGWVGAIEARASTTELAR